ncbi:snapalysin family zinc-dependent metalloprotease [Amycolatopsis sp. cg5]|uniref:snapalysin family zinc-dependent metalloprotease n=1 Tax=Amycolatopsis sp. cg5 TaxID=3238802 RepID=UPI0035236202
MSKKTFFTGAAALAVIVLPLTAGMATAAPAVTTVYYDASGAPSFASAISSGAANWNKAVSNVQLKPSSSGATLRYVEGNDPQGSYADTDGHGTGTIFIDFTQANQYDIVRITAHETGHALGLPDHYEGPCSELMSGGGPGPSCHNANPNATEASRVESLWANGLVSNRAGTQRIYG